MAEVKQAAPDYLGMSDEDILNMTGPVIQETEDNEDDEKENAEAAAEEVTAEAEDENQSSESTEDDDASEEAEEAPSETVGLDDTEDSENKSADSEENDDKDSDNSAESKDKSSIDYKAEYERLLAPFRANGREIKVNGVDDAISLMQMGANYNKKMAALKPNLKLMKMLENNNLLSEDKISFLIDLEKKNPDAINKLIKDSGIDPMDLDAEKASEYKRTTYTVDDKEIELDSVLADLQGSPSYNQTLDVVANKWDAASKRVIADSPQLLRVINDHMQSGIYELINKEVENERLFGRLNGLSDIEAYRRVGDALHAQGAFNHLVRGSSPTQGKPAAQTVVTPPKPKPADDAKLKDKKRAASPTKPAVSTKLSEDFNPLSLSDDEFSKLVNKQFL